MSDNVYKVNPNLPLADKIKLLNDMILDVDGQTAQGAFNKNEIDSLYTDTDINRKYLRNQLLGNTLETYTGWTHFSATDGYSIWKYTPTNYAYNSLNELYLDGAVLTNRGEITSGETVVEELALTATQIMNAEWAWCTDGSDIYVTIRNTGNAAYAGDYFINQYNTATVLQNYFVYNHTFKANYEDSTYTAGNGVTQSETTVTSFDIVITNGLITSFTKNG